MSKVWFTSDTHFGHKNVIEYCGRPFKDVDEMNEELVRRWNVVVSDEDTVYHLGDVALTSKSKWMPYVQRLKGHKILIKGNHDQHTNKSYYDSGFSAVCEHYNLCTPNYPTNGYFWLLNHKPVFDFKEGCNGMYPPNLFQYHFCGHVHTRWTRKGNIINVGVDKWAYAPVSFEELIQAKEDYPSEVVEPERDKGKGYYGR